ncbi:MAG: hypothetical protein QG610_2231 [Euryarchaeota archaeon]|nr:hypothetical protein [Euryarchaeota archaeon]
MNHQKELLKPYVINYLKDGASMNMELKFYI